MRPYLRVANVFEDRIDTSDVLSMNFTPEEYERYALQKGDILLNEGQSRELVGRPAIYRGEVHGACFQNTLIRFQVGHALLPEFALAVFRHYLHTGRFAAISKWTTSIAHLGAERFAGLELPVPPLAEQRRIVATLDALFIRSRSAKASLERVLALIERLHQAILLAAFQGNLSGTFRANEGTAQRVVLGSPDARGNHAHRAPKSPQAHSVLESRLPTGWSQMPLGQVAEVQVGYAFKSHEFDSHGVRLLRGINVVPGTTRWDEVAYLSKRSTSAYTRYLLNVGDIVLAMDRPIIASGLKVTRITATDCPALLVQRVARITGRTGVSTDFLFSFLQSTNFIDHLRDQATGTQLPHVSASDIGAALVPVPPFDEQQEIVRQLALVDEVLGRLRRSVDAAQVRTDVLERMALAAACRGELVPQDPNDEPASALLERIRAEREASQPVKSKRGASTSAPTRAPKGAR